MIFICWSLLIYEGEFELSGYEEDE